jgi:hypothetical protein
LLENEYRNGAHMICPNCRGEVGAAKFCSNCGASLAKEDKKPRGEFSVAWVRGILGDLEYEVSEIQTGENGDSFTARHKAKPNLLVDYRPALRVVLFTSLWTAKVPGMLDQGEFFKSLNSLNNDTVSCQCSVDETSLDTLCIQYSFFVTDVVSRADLTAFVEYANNITNRVVNRPRAKKLFG